MKTEKVVLGLITGFTTLIFFAVMATSKNSAGLRKKILSNGKRYAGELKHKFNEIQEKLAENASK